MTNVADVQRGKDAFKHFHNASVGFLSYGQTFEGAAALVSKFPDVFFDGFGRSIASLNMSESQVKEAMQNLAKKAQGRIPAQTVFFQALSDRLQNFTFIEAAGFTAVESAKDLGTGIQKVGDTLITTLKGLGFIFPFLVIGGLTFYVYRKVKRA